jgi:hypothetical protein
MNEQLMTIPARLCHFLIREYISSCSVYHTLDGHMAQFSMLCDYIQQGRVKQLKTHKKFKKICGCL